MGLLDPTWPQVDFEHIFFLALSFPSSVGWMPPARGPPLLSPLQGLFPSPPGSGAPLLLSVWVVAAWQVSPPHWNVSRMRAGGHDGLVLPGIVSPDSVLLAWGQRLNQCFSNKWSQQPP